MERFQLEEAWKGMLWMERHMEILQNSKSWLYLKSSDFALECSAVGEGSKFFFSLSSLFVSLVSSFLLVGWLILVEFPLNPMHSCSLFARLMVFQFSLSLPLEGGSLTLDKRYAHSSPMIHLERLQLPWPHRGSFLQHRGLILLIGITALCSCKAFLLFVFYKWM